MMRLISLLILFTVVRSQSLRGRNRQETRDSIELRKRNRALLLERFATSSADEYDEWKILGVKQSQVRARRCSKILHSDKILCVPVSDKTIGILDAVEASALSMSFLERLRPSAIILEELPLHHDPADPTFLTTVVRRSDLNHVGVLPRGSIEDGARRFLSLKSTDLCREWELISGYSYTLYNINCAMYRDQKASPRALFY